MTEKRFYYVKPSSECTVPRIYDKKNNTTETYAPHQLITLLNELNDENQELKNSEAYQEYERRLLNLININKETIDENRELKKEISKLKETLNLIADAHSATKEESVKDILRHAIYGMDTVAGESANAFHDYMLLSTFFKEHYKEHWDNFDD